MRPSRSERLMRTRRRRQQHRRRSQKRDSAGVYLSSATRGYETVEEAVVSPGEARTKTRAEARLRWNWSRQHSHQLLLLRAALCCVRRGSWPIVHRCPGQACCPSRWCARSSSWSRSGGLPTVDPNREWPPLASWTRAADPFTLNSALDEAEPDVDPSLLCDPFAEPGFLVR